MKVCQGESSSINYGPFINEAQVAGSYTEELGHLREISATTQEATVVDGIKVYVMIKVDKEIVKLGELLKYTINITNLSSISIEEVVLIDHIPFGTQLMYHSIKPKYGCDGSLEKGIYIGSIKRYETKTLEFSIVIKDPPGDEIRNEAQVFYSFRDSLGRIMTKIKDSNLTKVRITHQNPRLEIRKIVNKDIVTQDKEEVVYTITTKNTGNVSIKDVTITDKIPFGMKYVKNSTIINEKDKVNANPEKGITIGDLKPQEVVKVRFCVLASL